MKCENCGKEVMENGAEHLTQITLDDFFKEDGADLGIHVSENTLDGVKVCWLCVEAMRLGLTFRKELKELDQ